MKMNLDMTFEEGKKVIEALHECAIKNGWNEDELDASGVMEEYTSAVDAALTAMGISVNIDNESDAEPEDNDEEWTEDEEGGYFNSDDSCSYSLTPRGEFVVRYMELGHPLEEALKIANILFGEGE